ncbi:hypothetical protein JTB14_003572 [Gonioctena quinquepunctata]|nr:hypothetical protein JTB14_003572 [Gonioctena quinquepunctata]
MTLVSLLTETYSSFTGVSEFTDSVRGILTPRSPESEAAEGEEDEVVGFDPEEQSSDGASSVSLRLLLTDRSWTTSTCGSILLPGVSE